MSKQVKKYRPYLSLPELLAIHSALHTRNTSQEVLSLSSEDRKVSNTAEYIIESIIRDINYERKSAALSVSSEPKLSNTNASSLFSDNEIASVNNVSTGTGKINKPKTDAELIDEMSEYDSDVLFAKEELKQGFISQEEYDKQVIEFKSKYGIPCNITV